MVMVVLLKMVSRDRYVLNLKAVQPKGLACTPEVTPLSSKESTAAHSTMYQEEFHAQRV